MDASCDNTYDEDNNIINSPNYPRMYPRYTNCTWNVSAPIGFQISVEPFSYSIGADKLSIYDAANSHSRRIALLWDNEKYNGTTSTTNNMFFWFESRWQDKGFQTTFSLIGKQMDCSYKRSSNLRILIQKEEH